MTIRSAIFLIGFIICLNIDYSFGEDIVLNSGVTYKNINVVKREPDRVNIVYSGGMATIYLKDCPEDIQQKYKYNASDAAIAKSERDKKIQASNALLQREQKTQVDNWKKQQAAREQQKADEIKYKAAQLENERLLNVQRADLAQEQAQKSQVMGEADEAKIQAKTTRIISVVPAATTPAVNLPASPSEQDINAAHEAMRASAGAQNMAKSPGVDMDYSNLSLSRREREELARRGTYQPAQAGVGPGRFVNPGRIAPESLQQQEMNNLKRSVGDAQNQAGQARDTMYRLQMEINAVKDAARRSQY